MVIRGKGSDFLSAGSAVDKSKGKNQGIIAQKGATVNVGVDAGTLQSLLVSATTSSNQQIQALTDTLAQNSANANAANAAQKAPADKTKPAEDATTVDTGHNWMVWVGVFVGGALLAYLFRDK